MGVGVRVRRAARTRAPRPRAHERSPMCGIVGTYWYSGGTADRALLARQVHALKHRGPDDVGLWSEGPIALGHRRLSIRDLSPAGRQPLSNEDNSVRVV